MKKRILYACEQVGRGHPDKICDYIADSLLDYFLKINKNSRVAIECMIQEDSVYVSGNVTVPDVDELNDDEIKSVVIEALKFCGVENAENYKITININSQSKEIAEGVDYGGAGDQGIVVGYACNDTETFLPLPYVLATEILKGIEELIQKDSVFSKLIKPDMKSEVVVEYEYDEFKTRKEMSKRIHSVVVSVQHSKELSLSVLTLFIKSIVSKIALQYGLNTDYIIMINPAGDFTVGGSYADVGVTGRKLMCDSYGSYARHGGGAYSGKDYTKIDRSGAYAARALAIELLKKYDLDECEVVVSYAIGREYPLSVTVKSNKGREFDEKLEKYVNNKIYVLTPNKIINNLKLKDVKYTDTTLYGHYGKKELPWENAI